MATVADCIDWILEHGWMIRAMRGMTVVAGICFLMAVFSRLPTLESCFVTLAADMTFLPLEQPVIIACMGGMACYAAIITVTNQVIVR